MPAHKQYRAAVYVGQLHNSMMVKALLCSVAFVALALHASPVKAQETQVRLVQANKLTQFSIAEQPLTSAIVKFAAQSGLNIMADGTLPSFIQAQAVQGKMSAHEALTQMLSGTGYSFKQNGARSFTLISQAASNPESDNTSVLQLETITITKPASTMSGLVGDHESAYRTTAAVSSTDGETLQQRNAGNIDNALRSAPGTFTRKAMSGAGVAVNIRGMEGYGRVNMMIDGARQNIRVMGHGVSGGSTFIDTDLLALSGAAGIGALGGAANFRTIGIDDVILPGHTYGAMTTIKYGNNAYDWSKLVAGGMRMGGVGIMGAFNRRDSGAPLSGVDEKGKRLHNYNMIEDLKSGLAKLELGDGQDHKLLLGGIWYDNVSAIRGEPQDYRNQTYTARYNYTPDSDLINLNVNAFYNDARVRFVEGNYKGQFNRDKGKGIDITNNSQFALSDDIGLKLTTGGAYYHDDVTTGQSWGTGGPGDGTQAISSLFADATFSYGIFDLKTGFHFDHFRLNGDVAKKVNGNLITENVKLTQSSFNPRVTVAVNPFDGLQFYTTYAKTFRPPSVTETFFPGAHSATPSDISPNPDLEGETSKGWEFGLNVIEKNLLTADDKLLLKANYFNNNVENYIN